MKLTVEKAPELEIIEDEKKGTGFESKVILYNDDWHSFEEVIVQLMKATRCAFEEARDKTFEVHTNGKAVVFNGEFSSCLKVSGVLEEIALHTQIET